MPKDFILYALFGGHFYCGDENHGDGSAYHFLFLTHPRDVSSCQSLPNLRESWGWSVCKRSQLLCYSLFAIFW